MKVIAIVPGSKNSFQFAHRQIESLRSRGVEVELFTLRSRRNIFIAIVDFVRLQILKRRFKPDIIHGHYGSVTGFVSALSFRTPVVVSFRGSDVNYNPAVSRLRNKVARVFSHLSSVL
ncbi:MAG: hypothetical protein KDD25_08720, partial [Bdellovibrionales bacterium]|nr:hypothetical protein [Bdellovibrionales bacterium]